MCNIFFLSPYLYNSASRFIAPPLLLTTSSGHRDLEYPGRSGRMQIDRPLRRNRTWFDLKTREEGGGRGTETRDGTTSSISFVPLSSSISNRSQDEYRIDAARTSSRRSGFTLQGVTRGRETKRERERGTLYSVSYKSKRVFLGRFGPLSARRFSHSFAHHAYIYGTRNNT